MTTTTLKIEGMTCGHCVAAVTRALEGVAGVETAKVDLGAGRAEVTYEPQRAAIGDLVAVIEEEGYSAAAE